MVNESLALVAAGALWLGVFISGRLLAVVFDRLDLSPSRLNVARVACSGAGMAVAAIISLWYFPAGVVLDLGLTDSTLAAVLLNAAIGTLIAFVAVWAVSRGVAPPLRDAGRFGPAPWSYRVVVLVAISAVVVPFELLLFGVYDVGPFVQIALFIVAFFGKNNLQTALAPKTGGRFREPTPTERERVRDAYEQFGRTPPPMLVIPPEDNCGQTFLFGLGDYEWVFVEETLLSDHTDEELAVVLAQADEQHRRGAQWLKVLFQLCLLTMLSLYLGYGVDTVLGNGSHWAFLTSIAVGTGALVIGFVLLYPLPRAARTRVFTADTFAAETLGQVTVRQVYADVGEDVLETRRNTGTFSSVPSLSDRLVRLDEMTTEQAD